MRSENRRCRPHTVLNRIAKTGCRIESRFQGKGQRPAQKLMRSSRGEMMWLWPMWVADWRWWAAVDFWICFEVEPIGFIVGTDVRKEKRRRWHRLPEQAAWSGQWLRWRTRGMGLVWGEIRSSILDKFILRFLLNIPKGSCQLGS